MIRRLRKAPQLKDVQTMLQEIQKWEGVPETPTRVDRSRREQISMYIQKKLEAAMNELIHFMETEEQDEYYKNDGIHKISLRGRIV